MVLLAFGVAALLGIRAWVGWTVLGNLGGSVLVPWLVQGVRGHRGGCLIRRYAWFGLAAPGGLLRLVANSPDHLAQPAGTVRTGPGYERGFPPCRPGRTRTTL